jgi:hypothetical protein
VRTFAFIALIAINLTMAIAYQHVCAALAVETTSRKAMEVINAQNEQNTRDCQDMVRRLIR